MWFLGMSVHLLFKILIFIQLVYHIFTNYSKCVCCGLCCNAFSLTLSELRINTQLRGHRRNIRCCSPANRSTCNSRRSSSAPNCCRRARRNWKPPACRRCPGQTVATDSAYPSQSRGRRRTAPAADAVQLSDYPEQ